MCTLIHVRLPFWVGTGWNFELDPRGEIRLFLGAFGVPQDQVLISSPAGMLSKIPSRRLYFISPVAISLARLLRLSLSSAAAFLASTIIFLGFGKFAV